MNLNSVLRLSALSILLSVLGCSNEPVNQLDTGELMNPVAERYVKLVLRVGAQDPGYVDAYYGPEDWADETNTDAGTLDDARNEGMDLLIELESLRPGPDGEEVVHLRHAYLTRQIQAVLARIDMLQGHILTFDQEARALYDAEPPVYDEAYFQQLIDTIAQALPEGPGNLHERYSQFQKTFIIPPKRLDAVFSAAIDECRMRTLRHLELPEGESFTVEYVTNKPWSGYNWYQGNSQSLIQVNTDLPIYIARAIDLACHEGYPGHHVYNTLLEKDLVRDRGWVEYSVYALYSPQSLIAEGSANYGIEMAFPGEQRQAFEREVLFPLAGLDPDKADQYYRVLDLVAKLDYARNEAARAYLNGAIDADSAAAWLSRFALMSPDRAAQTVRFFEAYRSYIINYNFGKDLVRQYVERTAGENASEDRRWEVFGGLLSSPRLPSGLR